MALSPVLTGDQHRETVSLSFAHTHTRTTSRLILSAFPLSHPEHWLDNYTHPLPILLGKVTIPYSISPSFLALEDLGSLCQGCLLHEVVHSVSSQPLSFLRWMAGPFLDDIFAPHIPAAVQASSFHTPPRNCVSAPSTLLLQHRLIGYNEVSLNNGHA